MRQQLKTPKLPSTNLCFKQKADSNIYQIYIYDDIEEFGDWDWDSWSYGESETSAKHFAEILGQIPDNAEIELYINSNGGSVKEGTAIFNMLKRHPAHKTGYVDGVAHSIAFVIFQACDHRVMGEGTSALIHEMWVCCCGNAEQLRKKAEQLDILMQSNRRLFMQRATGITEEELAAMMREEHILTPDEALQYGFCDEIAERTAPVQESGEIQQNIKNIRQEFQKCSTFEEELREFETHCKTETDPEKSEDEPKESADIMSAFFSAFI